MRYRFLNYAYIFFYVRSLRISENSPNIAYDSQSSIIVALCSHDAALVIVELGLFNDPPADYIIVYK